MRLLFKLNDHTEIELEEETLYPGRPECISADPYWSSPSEGPELAYPKGWITRGKKCREVNGELLVRSLQRRYGRSWRDEMEVA